MTSDDDSTHLAVVPMILWGYSLAWNLVKLMRSQERLTLVGCSYVCACVLEFRHMVVVFVEV